MAQPTGDAVKFLAGLERQSKPFLVITGFVLIAAIGVIDLLLPYELSLSVFYVLPIALITWFTSRRYGVAASLASALVWLGADVASRPQYFSPLIPIWNTLIRFSFFLIITLLLSALRTALRREAELARIDDLTGAANSRHFYDLALMELDRFQRYRHPFTLVYIDLDNFKSVNDQLGHASGDQVLRTVVGCIKKNMRRTDLVARIGGDEFVLLLPETDEEFASAALAKLQNALLAAMRQNNWVVTFSMGALTCTAAPPSIDAMMKMTDDLMYAVKRNGKNALKHSTFAG